MKRVYIASSLSNSELNRKVFEQLTNSNISSFLPESIENGGHYNNPSQYRVSDICYKEIEQCDIMVAICPFGKSVAAELGYAICEKRKGIKKHILTLFMDFKSEAMIVPYIEKDFDSINKMVDYIEDLD